MLKKRNGKDVAYFPLNKNAPKLNWGGGGGEFGCNEILSFLFTKLRYFHEMSQKDNFATLWLLRKC